MTHLPLIDWGQMRVARPCPGGLINQAAAGTQSLDPETAETCITKLGIDGQPGACVERLAGGAKMSAPSSNRNRLRGQVLKQWQPALHVGLLGIALLGDNPLRKIIPFI